MNYLNIKMNSKKNLTYAGKLVLGEKFDHNIYSLKFTIPDQFKQNHNYVVFYNTEHNLKYTYKLDENDSVAITANITQHPIEYKIFLVMCKTENLEDDNNIVCVSEDIKGTVKDNILTGSDDIEDDTDPMIIFLNSDLYSVNNKLELMNTNLNELSSNLSNGIETNTEAINELLVKIQELQDTTLKTLSDKIDQINLGNDEIIGKVDELKEQVQDTNILIVDIKNNSSMEAEILDEINYTLTDVLYN